MHLGGIRRDVSLFRAAPNIVGKSSLQTNNISSNHTLGACMSECVSDAGDWGTKTRDSLFNS